MKKKSIFISTLKRTISRPASLVGFIIFLIIVILCAGAPLFTDYAPSDMDLDNLYSPPGNGHFCGTDAYGRDIWSRLLYGGRYSLVLGLCSSLFGTLIGIVFGSIAGYFGGSTETVIMRIMDIWNAIPGQLLSIVISAALGSGFFNTMLALSIGGIPGSCRMIRGQILSERGKEYLEAAQTINCSNFSIMFRHLLPNVISPLIVSTTMKIGNAISQAAGLSFIGLGVQPPTPEWGAMLSQGRNYIMTYPYLITIPGIAIALTILSLNMLGDGLRDALDPKLRQ